MCVDRAYLHDVAKGCTLFRPLLPNSSQHSLRQSERVLIMACRLTEVLQSGICCLWLCEQICPKACKQPEAPDAD